jgi:hypothetical protein
MSGTETSERRAPIPPATDPAARDRPAAAPGQATAADAAPVGEPPVFVIGTGRCGSTVLYDILSKHPNASWLSQLCQRYPHRPALNARAMRALDLPVVSRLARRYLYADEAYRFWERICPGFSAPCRDLRGEDVTPRVRRAVRDAFAQATAPSRPHLLLKITGWPRIRFLREIFPGAKFVHVYRDGRSVVYSGLQVPWFSAWRGPAQWNWGELSAAHREKWERSGRDFIVLGAIVWEMLMDATEAAKAGLPATDFMELSYEDLCADPVAQLRRVVGFAGLRWTAEFEAGVRGAGLRSTNEKWRQELTPLQQDRLEGTIRGTLERYGYC